MGDEGFFCDPGHAVYEYNCQSGVDTVALAKLPNVDVLSFHLYPDHWRKDAAWGTEWIKQHIDAAEQVGKPVVLGEFGWHDKADRNLVYREWTDTAAGYRGGVDGALYWILSDIQAPGELYPAYDGFTVYCPSPVCTTLGNFSERMRSGRTSFPPVADDDSATTDYGTAATVDATYNDIAYDGATIDARTLDLAPETAGRQTSYAAAGGTFAADDTGQVTFRPADGFVGRSRATYAVQDTRGRASNVATVTDREPVPHRAGDPVQLRGRYPGVGGRELADRRGHRGSGVGLRDRRDLVASRVEQQRLVQRAVRAASGLDHEDPAGV